MHQDDKPPEQGNDHRKGAQVSADIEYSTFFRRNFYLVCCWGAVSLYFTSMDKFIGWIGFFFAAVHFLMMLLHYYGPRWDRKLQQKRKRNDKS